MQGHMPEHMPVTTLIEAVKSNPASVEFNDVISTIEAHYNYTPAEFSNGIDNPVINPAGSNEGSCKIFAFAQLNNLSESETLACFGQYYRNDVLQHPEGTDHANIRTFMKDGWPGIKFSAPALSAK